MENAGSGDQLDPLDPRRFLVLPPGSASAQYLPEFQEEGRGAGELRE